MAQVSNDLFNKSVLGESKLAENRRHRWRTVDRDIPCKLQRCNLTRDIPVDGAPTVPTVLGEFRFAEDAFIKQIIGHLSYAWYVPKIAKNYPPAHSECFY